MDRNRSQPTAQEQGVPPTETPPAEGQTAQARSDNTRDDDSHISPNVSRAPAVITIVALAVMVTAVLVYIALSITNLYE